MKKPIKVIKGADRERAKNPVASDGVKAERDPAREIVRTVSDWIGESKRKRDANSKLAFEDLFAG
jgi:hypothetical protein